MKQSITAGLVSALSLLVSPAISMAGVLVYMPLGTANAVAVVDAGSDKVVTRIPGVINSHGLAITPDGSTMVAGSLTELPEGDLPSRPERMSAEEHRSHHSLPEQQQATESQSENRGILYLIDVKQRHILNQIQVPGPSHHNLITPDGKYAISTHPTSGLISVVDISRSKVVKTIQTGSVPNYTVVNRDGSRLYVSNSGDNTVSEINTKNWLITRQLPAGDTPTHLALSSDEHSLYIINENTGTASALDLNRGRVVRHYDIGSEAHGLALARDGRFLYASSKGENWLIAINLATGKTRTLVLAPAPYHIAFIPRLNKIYVSSRKLPKVWVIDTGTFSVRAEINLGDGVAHQMVVRKTEGGLHE